MCDLPFLIAGVGGILRFDDPAKARDIDLVAVGLKYAPVGRHNFDHVEEFTGIVNTYFDRLVTNLISQGVDVTSFIKLRSGSGPFKDHNKEFKGKLRMIDLGIDLGVEVKSDLDSFGCYNSKGLQIVYEGLRPVDIQFSFNMTPGDWKQEQVRLTDIIGSKLEAKSREFPYAVLLERQESQRDV